MSGVILWTVALAGTIAIAILLVHALFRRFAHIADGSSSTPITDRPTHKEGGSREYTLPAGSNIWQSAIMSDLAAAEELLDRMEAEGYQECELLVLGNSTFLVRWRGRA
jgi:hypothetical protein